MRDVVLINAILNYAALIGADLSRADLTNADLFQAQLTDVLMTDAIVSGTSFRGVKGFSREQLYSTASYNAGDLRGIEFQYIDMTGWSFSGKDIAESSLRDANLSNADFNRAVAYQTRFNSAGMSNASFREANLMGANFSGAILEGADFVDAEIRGADFGSTVSRGFDISKLSTTDSYKNRNLSGIRLGNNVITGWDLSGMDLTGASFFNATLHSVDLSDSDLSGATFTSAELMNVDLSGSRLPVGVFNAVVGGVDFEGADARGDSSSSAYSATIRNLVHPNGRVYGLDVREGEIMRIWDHNVLRPPPTQIRVEDTMMIAATGILRLVFEDDAWGSLITFDAGIPVSLDGSLELLFDADADISGLVGTTYQLFDWTGADPTGVFSQIVVQPGTTWDTSNLYTTGEVTLLTAIPEPSGITMIAAILAARRGRRRV